MNTASRMESHGIPGKIQVTEQVYKSNKDTYTFEARGSTAMKGKGKMNTWNMVDNRS